ncbi:MAG: hypothetical protein JO123_06325, partial [Ktedonobacteraceae bacterium]|nr:hypothetical protein [Ktedonobacteraceae bacterium]
MDARSSWRDLLAEIIREREAHERLAQQIGVNPVTITHWTQEASIPRPESLIRLLHAVPTTYA